ncbi:hypothetical protein AciM339_0216 [Aciduliprofundum sp. MAR08-339]|uniref:hypothetical protein n=1 Tax=Aciduliprofundum sp. (strain MAR08-339) TaxID=673860 RepID=UPI0002A4B61D|nr:hypothetical protein AciM339_0184 [Aciduliprofundum sp. MAR08-339]AGB04113.1 hypothetical protein AciM339_0216 [Aciduliprofundum sp. MAR08-339]
MSYTYVAQKMREYDFWLRESRLLPEDISPFLKKAILLSEEGYRRGDLDRRKAVLFGVVFREKYGFKYRVVSDRHLVIIPKSPGELMRAFLKYPQLLAIIGNRHSGKTITAWTLSLQALEKMPDAMMYVYGDVDGLGEQIIKMKPELGERIIIKKYYSLPPLDGRKKIVLYNELAPALMSKKALSNANVEMNLQALRSRHLSTWVIYNVIRTGSLESTLRDTADIKMFRWTTAELLANTMQYLPKGWQEILKICTSLNINEGLVFAPVPGKGTKIFIHETNPPQWLLEAAKRAKEDTLLMMVKSEKERYILERIGRLYEKGLGTKEIKLILEREGINLSERSIRAKHKNWKKLVGLLDEEVEKNK